MINATPQELANLMQELIEKAIEGANANVKAISPGHFEIAVNAPSLAGMMKVKQQQQVYGAIAHLLVGAQAPVHAIDKMEIQTA